MSDRFAVARKVADAVLYEGYVLYPYRASAPKNQLRWQFGVLAPRAWTAVDPSERWRLRTDVVVEPGRRPLVTIRVRCLHVQQRTLEALTDSGSFVPTSSLSVDGTTWVPWDEAAEREIDLDPIRIVATRRRSTAVPFDLPAVTEIEPLVRSDGTTVGRALRHHRRVEGMVRVTYRPADGHSPLARLTVEVENRSIWAGAETDGDRDAMLRRSMVAVHTLLAVDDGRFISQLDPPVGAEEAVGQCKQDGAFPVLIGPEGSTDVMLASPIILYDHPSVAPESEGDFCDATEIDEILALRVLTLTDEEKAEARGTDARAAAIVDRCDDMSPATWERLHGTIRPLGPDGTITSNGDPPAAGAPGSPPDVAVESNVPWWDPGADASVDPSTDTLLIDGVVVGEGSKVVLRPSRRADAHDLFLAGEIATVAGVFNDVDGNQHVAVTLDADPATEMLAWQKRYLYFHPDEVVPAANRLAEPQEAP